MKSKEERGIYKRGNTFVVDIMVKGKRAVEVCPSHEVALIRRDELRAQLRRAAAQLSELPSGGNSWSIHKALRTTVEVRWRDSKDGDKAAKRAAEAEQFFGRDTCLDQLTTADIDRWIKQLKAKGNQAGTINRKLYALSALFTDAMQRGGCSRKPRMERQQEPMHRIRYLSEMEERMVCMHLLDWGERACHQAVVVLLDTGMRVGELMALRVNDIDLGHNLISVWENKGELPRSIPMTDRVREVIGDRCITRKGELFSDLRRSHLDYVWKKVRKAMDLAGDGEFVLHALRHTCATRLVQRGVSLYAVQKLLGHADITVTEKYAHLSNRELTEAINVLQQPTTYEHGVLWPATIQAREPVAIS